MRNTLFTMSAALLLLRCGGEGTPAANESIAVPQAFEVTLSRSACFGTCPSYVASINASGDVQWQGKACVDQTGATTGQRTAAEASAVFQALIDGGFWTYQDRYVSAEDGCEVWTDAPTVEITVRATGLDKTLVHYHGCRGISDLDALAELEDELDRLIDTQAWKGAPRTIACE